MNPFGSYRALLGNSVAALCAAIEIYNKPQIAYRDESSVILLVNAWELALKALLSKNRQRIFYRKKKGQPYRTYSLSDALNRATPFFPASVDLGATAKNLELLVDYRDNAIHFYNQAGFGAVFCSLAQTAIVNLRDLLKAAFDFDVSSEVSTTLVPLSLGISVDPLSFLRDSQKGGKASKAVKEFTARLQELVAATEAQKGDLGRLLTVCHVSLQSTKKIAASDFLVGVDGTAGGGTPVLVQKVIDPNKSHPLRETDIISSGKKKGMGLNVGGLPLTQFPFRAIVHFLSAKDEPKYCWSDETGAVTRYSQAFLDRVRTLTQTDRDMAINAYKAHIATKSKKGKA